MVSHVFEVYGKTNPVISLVLRIEANLLKAVVK